MACKYIYLGQDWETEELNGFGIGSVYLAGPRNNEALITPNKSWRLDLIKKISSSGLQLTFLIPEPKNRGQEIPAEKRFKWQQSAMAAATAVLFWFPLNEHDAQSLVEFGCWCKSERVFLGGDPSPEMEYLDWLLNTEQKIRATNSLDQLTERFVHWILG